MSEKECAIILKNIQVKLFGHLFGQHILGGIVGENSGVLRDACVDIYGEIKTESEETSMIGGAIGRTLPTSALFCYSENVIVNVHEGAKISGGCVGGFVGFGQVFERNCEVNLKPFSCLESCSSISLEGDVIACAYRIVGGFVGYVNLQTQKKDNAIVKSSVNMDKDAKMIVLKTDSPISYQNEISYIGGFIGAVRYEPNNQKLFVQHCVAKIEGELINESDGTRYVSLFSEESKIGKMQRHFFTDPFLMENNYLIGQSSQQKNVYEIPVLRVIELLPQTDTYFLRDGSGFCVLGDGSEIVLESNDLLELNANQALRAKGGSGFVKGYFYNLFINQTFPFTYYVKCPWVVNPQFSDTKCFFNGDLQYAKLNDSLKDTPYIVVYQKMNGVDSYWISSTGEKGGSLSVSDVGIYTLKVQFTDTQYVSLIETTFCVEPYGVVKSDFIVNNLLQISDRFQLDLVTIQLLNVLIKPTDYICSFDGNKQEIQICFSGNVKGDFAFPIGLKKQIENHFPCGIGFYQTRETRSIFQDDAEIALILKKVEKINVKIRVNSSAFIQTQLYSTTSHLIPILNTNDYWISLSTDINNIKLRLVYLAPFDKGFVSIKIIEARDALGKKIPVFNSSYTLSLIDQSPHFEFSPLTESILLDSTSVNQKWTLKLASQLTEKVKISEENSACFFTYKKAHLSIEKEHVSYTLSDSFFQYVNRYGLSDQFLLNCRSNINEYKDIPVRLFLGRAVTQNKGVDIDFSKIKKEALIRVERKCPAPYGVYTKPFQKLKQGVIEKESKMSLAFDENDPQKVVLKGSINLINRTLLKKLQKQMLTHDALQKLIEEKGLVHHCGLSIFHRATYRVMLGGKVVKQRRTFEVGTVLFSPPVIDSVKFVVARNKYGEPDSYLVVFGDNLNFKYKCASSKQLRESGLTKVATHVPKGTIETLVNGKRKAYSLVKTSGDFLLKTNEHLFINGQNGCVIYKAHKMLNNFEWSAFYLVIDNASGLDTYSLDSVEHLEGSF